MMLVWMNGFEENKVERLIDFEMGGDFFHYMGNKLYKAFDHASDIEPEIEVTQKPKYPEYPKPILRKAYEIIGRLKAENLKRAGFPDSDIFAYLDADKELKEIESHLNK